MSTGDNTSRFEIDDLHDHIRQLEGLLENERRAHKRTADLLLGRAPELEWEDEGGVDVDLRYTDKRGDQISVSTCDLYPTPWVCYEPFAPDVESAQDLAALLVAVTDAFWERRK